MENWSLTDFENGAYSLLVYGPNGFFRSFNGNSNDPSLVISDGYRTAFSLSKVFEDKLVLTLSNQEAKRKMRINLTDKSYGSSKIIKDISASQTIEIDIDTTKTHGWYDFEIEVEGFENFKQQFAGRVETGEIRKTDPLIGKAK